MSGQRSNALGQGIGDPLAEGRFTGKARLEVARREPAYADVETGG